MWIFLPTYISNRGQSIAFKKLSWIYIVVAVLVKFSLSFTSLRTQNLGQIFKHQYPNFYLIDALPQAEHKSLISNPNYQIIINLLRSLPKTQSCIQIVCLPGGGIFELIFLTLPNNFNNKIVLVKEDPQEFAWVNKNLYLNGLQKETKLYYTILGSKNIVSYQGMQRGAASIDIFYRNRNCLQCNVQYRIQTNLSNLIGIEEEQIKKKGVAQLDSGKQPYLQLFLQLKSKGDAKVLNQQLANLQERYKIQSVLYLKVPIPLQILINNLIKDQKNKQKQRYKIYQIKLKISNKKSSLQFSQILYLLSTNSPIKSQIILEEGIYYMAQNDLLFSSQSSQA